MPTERNVCSTMKNLMNTVGNIRQIANKILHYNPATTPLTEVQIRWLLASPLESVIKNVLFFNMIYCAMLQIVKRDYIIQLLETIGLKEEAARYDEWIEDQATAAWSYRMTHEEVLHPELFHPVLKPQPVHTYDELTLHLDQLRKSYTKTQADLLNLHDLHNLLIESLILYHYSHTKLICSHAADHGITLHPDHVMMLLPNAMESYRNSKTPEEKARALQILNSDGQTVHNVTRLEQFLGSGALLTMMLQYQERIDQFNTDFSKRSTQLLECKMRCAHLENRVQATEVALGKLSKNTPEPTPTKAAKLRTGERKHPERSLHRTAQEILGEKAHHLKASFTERTGIAEDQKADVVVKTAAPAA